MNSRPFRSRTPAKPRAIASTWPASTDRARSATDAKYRVAYPVADTNAKPNRTAGGYRDSRQGQGSDDGGALHRLRRARSRRGQRQPEGRARGGLVEQLQRAAHPLGKLATDREAEP